MHADLLEFFGPQEERLTVAGRALVVRTLPDDSDLAAVKDGTDVLWKFMVRCTFLAADHGELKAGAQVFTDADIEHLKAAPRIKILPLIKAVENVNAFDVYDTVKNSNAVPSGG